ncbi:hypothetical protein [Paludisphaera rhizosphaerae]|uniref:hypothetical protein n=1 Tax=Paludisphaera rhizosphaerae TaxID=2711216 RepID=UPI0013E9ACAF|nr:hypothetical protein [Paludisphaera rhizosphaerae]
MKTGVWIRSKARPLGYLLIGMCMVGSLASLFVLLVRVPALAVSRMDELYGTLLGAAVAMAFVIAALLINLTLMVYTATNATVPQGPRS